MVVGVGQLALVAKLILAETGHVVAAFVLLDEALASDAFFIFAFQELLLDLLALSLVFDQQAFAAEGHATHGADHGF